MEADQLLASRYAADWLRSQGIALAVTAHQAGLLLLLGGLDSAGRMHLELASYERCMGMAADGESLWVAGAWEIWRLAGLPADRGGETKFDRLYAPRAAYAVGDLEVHDLAPDGRGGIHYVSPLLSAVMALDATGRVDLSWHPPFVSRLAPEDRCHMNGLAVEDGKPRYVTVCARSDVADGWRDHRRDGGCVLDVATGEVVASGLSMPHSPRLHRGELWLAEAGTGRIGRVDRKSGTFEPIAFCPGYVRGLAFHERFALVTTSLPRHHPTFTGLALEESLAEKGAQARCGIHVIDVDTGEVAHWFRFEGRVQELYDVAVLPGTVRPGLLGPRDQALRHRIWAIREGKWLGWTRGLEPAPAKEEKPARAPAPVRTGRLPFAVVELIPGTAPLPALVDRLARLLASGLAGLGRECRIERNTFPQGHVCLVLGSSWANEAIFSQIASSVDLVVVQYEPLLRVAGLLERRLPVLARAREVWSLSPAEPDALSRRDVRAKHLALGRFGDQVAPVAPAGPRVDVLCLDPLDGRHEPVLAELAGKCSIETLPATRREGRAERIAAARVVLSIPTASPHPFPISLRLHEPLSQDAFVLCEAEPENPYLGGVVEARYEELASSSLRFLGDENARRRTAEEGARILGERSMTDRLRPLVEGLAGISGSA
ncbi:MAG: TIGR03032 family protein [Planctomycetes bacterium]|nr:TIGR03032 family protein [Planctomycetota bacterium]